ncbi:MAG: CHAT domain-containing protein [Verrucomicrobia bacterium]|nr:CHAT domain-containing protein [Verrucomicrobiota bacterium]
MRAGQPVFLAALLLISNCAIGVDSAEEVSTLVSQIVSLYQQGKCAEALPLARRALEITEKAQGPNDRDTATCLTSVAEILVSLGDYTQAEPLHQRALKIRKAVLGPDHIGTATSLNNLALLYHHIGDYEKAEPLYKQALKIRQAKLGPEHLGTAMILNNLAALYYDMGDYAKAELRYKQAQHIKETKLGFEHFSTAAGLNNLAEVYRATGDYAKAESCHQHALEIYEKVRGPEHPDTAESLNNLAQIHVCIGDYAKAEPRLLRSLRIKEKHLGPNHPATATALGNLSLVEFTLGHSEAALGWAIKHKAAVEENLGRVLAFASERQRMAYQRTKDLHALLGTLGSAPELAESLLRTKGIVLDSLLEDQLAAEAPKNPEVKNTVNQLRATGRQLNQLQMGIPGDLSPEALKRRQSERENLEQQVEELQKMLARNVAGMGQTRRALRTKVSDVQAVLPEKTVLLEFVRYGHYLGKGRFEQRYGAVLIGNPQMTFKDAKPGEPVWVPLGSAETIEQSLKDYGEMMRGVNVNGVNLLHTLYTLLFEPIQKRLPKDITTLVISPDVELNFVSFATFVDDQDKFLAEQYAIQYVSSGRDLVLKRTAKTGTRRFAAFANPAFGEKPMLAGAHSTNAVQLAVLSSDQRDYRGEILKPLPYTIQEAQFLREKSSSWNMDGSVYAGAEASEVEVKAVRSPYILHLATHGFFLPDTMTTNSTTGRQLLGNDRAPIVPHNPMQRSGLAFAGAQLTLDAWKKGQTPNTENDGILMGQEIGTMDLKETWLVVLSACDTGIGEARAGEGVLGLRRGFIQAGAQNLLMTLWPVSDKWTVDLMKAFYERALKDNNAPQALAEVQRQWLARLRQEGVLTAARLAGPFILTFQGSN